MEFCCILYVFPLPSRYQYTPHQPCSITHWRTSLFFLSVSMVGPIGTGTLRNILLMESVCHQFWVNFYSNYSVSKNFTILAVPENEVPVKLRGFRLPIIYPQIHGLRSLLKQAVRLQVHAAFIGQMNVLN